MGRLLVLPTPGGLGAVNCVCGVGAGGYVAGDWLGKQGSLSDGPAFVSGVELPGDFCLRSGDADRQPHCGARRP